MPVELSKPYCTVQQVRDECRNDDTAVEDTFASAVNRASRFIEEHCRADFWYHDHTVTPLDIPQDWIACKAVYFPWPIIDITLVEDTSAGPNVSYPIDSATYRVEKGIEPSGTIKSRGILHLSSRVPKIDYLYPLRITGEFGFTLADDDDETAPPDNLPSAINRACILIAASFSGLYMKQWKEGGAGGAVQEMLQTNVPKEALILLARWRRFTI